MVVNINWSKERNGLRYIIADIMVLV